MKLRGLAAAALAVALATAGCGDDAGSTTPDAGQGEDYIGPSAMLFEVPRDGAAPPSGFYALPFPNDIRVGDDGRIDFADYRRPNALIDNYVESFAAKQRGFSPTAGIFVRFTHPIDADSLPATPADAQQPDASVYLVNVEPDSARRGETTPLRFRFEHYAGETIGENWLSTLPYPGFVLEQRATHALVVTTRLRATDGSAVATADDFAALLAADAPDDPDLARARELYAPLRDWLDEPGGDERADVIGAAVFTTGDATSEMAKLREAVFALDEPTARDLVLGGENETYVWYDGAYDAPNFQTGTPPYMTDGGEIVFDEDTGLPIVQRTEQMRLSFSVPAGELPASGWPVVLYAHGTGGSYHTYRTNGTARRLAEQGLAVVGIDQVLHGPRNPGASPEISFFNFQNPLAARDNPRQGAIDNVQLLRLVRGFDFTDADAGRTVRFDPERIYFFGHSQGGLTGPPWLAYEPEVDGAVLSGAGALLYLSLLHKTEPVNIPEVLGAIIRDYPLDEFNPMLALVQMWLDVSDPATYAHLLFREPPAGVAPKHIFQSEGFVDRYTPNISIEAFAVAMGVDQVAPIIERVPGLELAGGAVLDAPVTGNSDGVTAVLLQYDEQAGSDGHFVLFDLDAARRQSAEFLGTLAATGTATVVAP